MEAEQPALGRHLERPPAVEAALDLADLDVLRASIHQYWEWREQEWHPARRAPLVHRLLEREAVAEEPADLELKRRLEKLAAR